MVNKKGASVAKETKDKEKEDKDATNIEPPSKNETSEKGKNKRV